MATASGTEIVIIGAIAAVLGVWLRSHIKKMTKRYNDHGLHHHHGDYGFKRENGKVNLMKFSGKEIVFDSPIRHVSFADRQKLGITNDVKNMKHIAIDLENGLQIGIDVAPIEVDAIMKAVA